jgi:hypothetical protein
MAGMKMRVFPLVLLLGCAGCDQLRSNPAIPIQPYQRFVPVPAPQAQVMGIPWTGFFALDTQIGQLCLTSGVYVPDKFSQLPTCETDLKTYPTPGQPNRQ